MVYNSWLTMQAKGETDPDTCAYNDFALIRLNPADARKVNPSVPFWGGPNAVGATTQLRDKVYSYGNSSLRGGVTQLSPKEGYSLGDDGGGWTHSVYTVTPGIPGDSGSAFLSKSGAALGVLSTVAIAPLAGSNGVGDVAKELGYMQANSAFSGVSLALGTEPFAGRLAAVAEYAAQARLSRVRAVAQPAAAASTSSRACIAVATSARSICPRNGSWRACGSSARSACR